MVLLLDVTLCVLRVVDAKEQGNKNLNVLFVVLRNSALDK